MRFNVMSLALLANVYLLLINQVTSDSRFIRTNHQLDPPIFCYTALCMPQQVGHLVEAMLKLHLFHSV